MLKVFRRARGAFPFIPVLLPFEGATTTFVAACVSDARAGGVPLGGLMHRGARGVGGRRCAGPGGGE
jgi:hypothetical protein